MKLPRARRARVDDRKVVGYLLSTRHPDGRSKAAFFGSFGFSAARWELLADALRDHGTNGEVTSIATSDYGTRYSVDGVLWRPQTVATLECEPSGSSTSTGRRASSPRIR